MCHTDSGISTQLDQSFARVLRQLGCQTHHSPESHSMRPVHAGGHTALGSGRQESTERGAGRAGGWLTERQTAPDPGLRGDRARPDGSGKCLPWPAGHPRMTAGSTADIYRPSVCTPEVVGPLPQDKRHQLASVFRVFHWPSATSLCAILTYLRPW